MPAARKEAGPMPRLVTTAENGRTLFLEHADSTWNPVTRAIPKIRVGCTHPYPYSTTSPYLVKNYWVYVTTYMDQSMFS